MVGKTDWLVPCYWKRSINVGRDSFSTNCAMSAKNCAPTVAQAYMFLTLGSPILHLIDYE